MALTECPYCQGARYLSRVEALGPCPCVTPADTLRLEAELRDLTGLADTDAGEGYRVLLEDAQSALEDWLTANGHPAAPLSPSGLDPNLWTLVNALIYHSSHG